MRIFAVGSWQPEISAVWAAEPFEVMEDEGRAVVLREAVDHLPHAGVHLVDHEPLLDGPLGVGRFGRFGDVHDGDSVGGLGEVVRGDPRGDGEGPGLQFGPSREAGQASGDAKGFEFVVGAGPKKTLITRDAQHEYVFDAK